MFCAVLGTTQKALTQRSHRTLDMRSKLPGDSGERLGKQTAAAAINLFFAELYHGAAEDLPDNIHT